MKWTLFILTITYSTFSYSGCAKTIEYLKAKKIMDAGMHFQGSCREDSENIGMVSAEQRNTWIGTIVSYYDECKSFYDSKNVKELRNCLNQYGMEDTARNLDKNFGTNFLIDIKKWATSLEVMKANAKRLEEEKVALALKQENDLAEKEASAKAEKAAYIKTRGIDIYKNACQAQYSIKVLMKQIDREKEVGKISGVVDTSVLHRLGSNVVALKEILSANEEEHVNRFKKPIDMAKCKCDGGALGIECK